MKIVNMQLFCSYVITMTLILFSAMEASVRCEILDCPRGWMDEEHENNTHSCVPNSITFDPNIEELATTNLCGAGRKYITFAGSCSDTPNLPLPEMEPDGAWTWKFTNGTEISTRTPPCPEDWYENQNGYCERLWIHGIGGGGAGIGGPCPASSQPDIYGKCRQYL